MGTHLSTTTRTAPILARIARQITPVLFADTPKTEQRFWEFFTAHLRNPNTRRAYLTAAYRFADWCEAHGLALGCFETSASPPCPTVFVRRSGIGAAK